MEASKSETIRVVGLTKRFGQVKALCGIDLEVEAGELFFLLGPSGCGKTTLLRCLAGLEVPTTGQIFFGEREVTKLAAHKREAAMVFQSYALWPHLSVAKNIAFGLEQRGVSAAEVKRRVGEALEMVHLDRMGERAVDEMSGGQQQRVSLARALVVRPRCLLLDEPLSNLDAKLRVDMRREIRRIVKEHDLTAVYVTHDQEEALAMADRMAILEDGVMAQVGAPMEIYRDPVKREVASFIGETNFIEGEVIGVVGHKVKVSTAIGEFAGRFPENGRLLKVGERAVLSGRPEAWQVVDALPNEQALPENILSVALKDASYLGSSARYLVELGEGVEWQIEELNPTRLRGQESQQLTIAIAVENLLVLPA